MSYDIVQGKITSNEASNVKSITALMLNVNYGEDSLAMSIPLNKASSFVEGFSLDSWQKLNGQEIDLQVDDQGLVTGIAAKGTNAWIAPT